MSSAELAQRMVKVKLLMHSYLYNCYCMDTAQPASSYPGSAGQGLTFRSKFCVKFFYFVCISESFHLKILIFDQCYHG